MGAEFDPMSIPLALAAPIAKRMVAEECAAQKRGTVIRRFRINSNLEKAYRREKGRVR